MTAVVIVAQPRHGLIHVAMDSAIYTPDHTVQCFGLKMHPISYWPGVVSALGNSVTKVLFHWSLSQHFSSFDDFVENGEAILPDLMKAWKLPDGLSVRVDGTQMIVAGISACRGPEAYSWCVDKYVPPGATAEEMEASEYYDAPWKLVKLPDVIMSPTADDQSIPANYEGIDVEADPDTVVWSIKKVLEMQRHTRLPDNLGAIGGFAQLTTISSDGINQRILQRWSEDRSGAPLKPEPIDWKQWHRDNPKPGMSRLKREMLERKARKSNIHLVRDLGCTGARSRTNGTKS